MINQIIHPLSCKLPNKKRAIEAIYSLLWKKERKERERMFIYKFIEKKY